MDGQEPVSFLSWSPDDARLLGCGASTEVKMWNTKDGKLIKEFGGHGGCVAACSFSSGLYIYYRCKNRKKNGVFFGIFCVFL